MVKPELKDVFFKIGDEIKIFLDQSTVEGRLVGEDYLGLTIMDAQIKGKFRFVRWEAIEVIEYTKKRGKNGKTNSEN